MVEAATHDESTKLFIVKTAKGEFKAKRVVYATNAYTAGLVPSVKSPCLPFTDCLFPLGLVT
jgi:glycine/D-amino acid oxidase-like deaminating enzyme